MFFCKKKKLVRIRVWSTSLNFVIHKILDGDLISLISAQKWCISCVSLDILVTCFASYLWKSSNLKQICQLCFLCITLPIYVGKFQARTKKSSKSAKATRLSELQVCSSFHLAPSVFKARKLQRVPGLQSQTRLKRVNMAWSELYMIRSNVAFIHWSSVEFQVTRLKRVNLAWSKLHRLRTYK